MEATDEEQFNLLAKLLGGLYDGIFHHWQKNNQMP